MLSPMSPYDDFPPLRDDDSSMYDEEVGTVMMRSAEEEEGFRQGRGLAGNLSSSSSDSSSSLDSR